MPFDLDRLPAPPALPSNCDLADIGVWYGYEPDGTEAGVEREERATVPPPAAIEEM